MVTTTGRMLSLKGAGFSANYGLAPCTRRATKGTQGQPPSGCTTPSSLFSHSRHTQCFSLTRDAEGLPTVPESKDSKNWAADEKQNAEDYNLSDQVSLSWELNSREFEKYRFTFWSDLFKEDELHHMTADWWLARAMIAVLFLVLLMMLISSQTHPDVLFSVKPQPADATPHFAQTGRQTRSKLSLFFIWCTEVLLKSISAQFKAKCLTKNWLQKPFQ